MQPSKKKFDCNLCKHKFVHLTGLERHKKKYHQDEMEQKRQLETATRSEQQFVDIVLKCRGCGEIFLKPNQYEAHSLHYNWESLLADMPACYIDRKECLYRKQMAIVVVHSLYRCEFCDTFFSDLSSLFHHQSCHDPIDGYSCIPCDKEFPTLDEILAHRATCAGFQNIETKCVLNALKMYSCNVCLGFYDTLPLLYEHRYKDHHYLPRATNLFGQIVRDPSLKLFCELCGCICDCIDTFLQHRLEQHSKMVLCVGATEDGIVKTQALPGEESNAVRPFLCEKCGKTYTQSSHLWQHLRFHNGVRPFACPKEGCTRRFTIRPDLNDHIRKCHTGERPYECKECHKRFLTGSVYYQHRLIHKGERRYACPDCARRFYRADALKNHQRIHTGEKPYSCSLCDRKFRQRGDREKHVRVKHLRMG
ncbi:testis-specific zinc finger protein topi-like [Anopheles nili]|uniref:testis-specific zinc finger protein topi-like n=1 Tax=Anopheles nili TaxID=185578 RepID=UPI00237B9596|nr:testis-specific zinc finger protein topi-like [Anopheles nili]